MHVLDDLAGFSDRAQAFLNRAGRRRHHAAARRPPALLEARDRSGRAIPAPIELTTRQEAFRMRYGGLRYEVRRSALIGRERHDVSRRWDFDLDVGAWTDRHGWYFSWVGERVSSPVRFVLHTDGRVGVSDGGPFIEVAPSIRHLIEGHAIMDMVAQWEPWPGSLEPWVPSHAGVSLADRFEGLTVAAEASGPYDTWLLSDHLAVRSFWSWTSRRPRTRAVQIWTFGDEGRRQARAASPRL